MGMDSSLRGNDGLKDTGGLNRRMDSRLRGNDFKWSLAFFCRDLSQSMSIWNKICFRDALKSTGILRLKTGNARDTTNSNKMT